MVVEAVLFDLWGTLVGPGSGGLPEGLAAAMTGGRPDPSERESIAAQLQLSGRRSTDQGFEDVAAGVWRRHRRGRPPASFLQAVTAVRERFVADARFLPGAPAAIEAVRAEGWRVGVISNATTVTQEVIRRLELGDAVDAVWLSCETGRLKPDPRAFLMASERWQIAPERMCMVGDTLAVDVLGARLAGMQAVWVSERAGGTCVDPGSSVLATVAHVGAVPGLLEQLTGSGVWRRDSPARQ